MEEYNENHIKNVKLIDVSELNDKVLKEIPNEETYILVYCRSGNISKTASNILIELV